jgi:hypothetical protein
MGEPLVFGCSGEKGKDIHPRIPKRFHNMREYPREVFMEERELGCSCHTPVLIANCVRSGTGGP